MLSCLSMAKNSRHRWAVLFSRVYNPSINDSSAVTSYWFTVAMVGGIFISRLVCSLIGMATVATRRTRYAHSKNFYRDLDNFSTAAVHKTKLRRKSLFSGEYFGVERLIATRKAKDEVRASVPRRVSSLRVYFLTN